jgi:type IV pilus modification protein PilV
MYSKYRKQDKAGKPGTGFALLEVMIAIVIFSIGLIALASMQGKLTRYASAAKQRTWAMNLAEDQLENMRAFVTLASTGTAACSVDPGSFDDLADCSTPVTATLGELTFNMTWATAAKVVSDDGVATDWDPTSTDSPDFKEITVTVAWTDQGGDTQSVALKDIVDATSVYNSAKLVAGSDEAFKPSVPLDLSAFPDTAPVDLGSGLSKLTTTPEPTIENSGNNVVTGFDVISYTNTGSFIDRIEEFDVVNCTCELNTGTSLGREPTYWDGEEYQIGAEVTKQTGTPSTEDGLDGQPFQCEACCRDHHDSSTSVVKYDPWRNEAANAFGNHNHYNLVNGSFVLATNGSPRYLEACRLVRVDGFMQVATDMSLENLVVVPEDLPTSQAAAYSTSVVNFMGDFVTGIDVSTYPGTTPTPTYSLTVPDVDFYFSSEEKQLAGRSIYVDFMQDDLLKKIKCLQANGTGTFSSFCDVATDPDWIDIVPFFELNTTSLATWGRTVANIDVTNSPISDVQKNSFSRGLVTVAATPTNGATSATSEIEFSNTGLTDTNAIDLGDAASVTQGQVVNVNIGLDPVAAGVGINGTVIASKGSINVESVRFYVNPPGEDCSLFTNELGQRIYFCDMDDAGTGTVTSGWIRISDYNATKIKGQNITILNRSVCAYSTGAFTTTVTDEGLVANPDLNIVGETTTFSFANLSADLDIDILIIDDNESCPAAWPL